MKHKNIFNSFASKMSRVTGSVPAFVVAVAIIAAWSITGPMFNYSDTWQLVINTGTTIITFLMVFLIQNTQNRDSRAVQIKLDELIRVTEGAHTALLDLEELSERELVDICRRYMEIARESRKLLRKGDEDTHIPDVKLGAKPKKSNKK